MIKILLTVAVVGSVGSFAGLAMAQSTRGEAFDGDVSSLLGKIEAQCEHRRRMMPPDPRNDCVARLRSEAQTGFGQDGAAGVGAGVGAGQAGGAGLGFGPGNGGGQGNGIGPGGNGGGLAKGRR